MRPVFEIAENIRLRMAALEAIYNPLCSRTCPQHLHRLQQLTGAIRAYRKQLEECFIRIVGPAPEPPVFKMQNASKTPWNRP